MTDVRRSFLLSFADNYLAIALQIASTVVIARLLTPAEVGVFAIAAVFSALASSFRDFGFAEYLIQARDLDHAKIRAALGMNIIVSWAMAATMFFAAPAVASFYNEAGVGAVMRVLALSFLIVPFGAVVQSWFRRELKYKPIVITNALSNITAFGVAVGLALQGHGYMSLAWSTFAGIAVTVLGSTYFRPHGFPRWPGFKGIAEVFHFGKFTTGMYILNQLGRGAPELIIGRVSGAADVGIFSRANGLVELFRRLLLKPVFQVCLPYFARAGREQGTVAPSYVSSVGLITAVGWPFLGFFALASYALIRIVYGIQWLDAVPLARILCLACAVELSFVLSREALLAGGDARRASVLQLQIAVMQVAGLALVIPYGLIGASWGLTAAAVGGLFVSQRHLHQAIGLELRPVLRACAPSALLALWTVGPLAGAALLVPIEESNFVVWAFAGSVACASLWLVGLRLIKHPLWVEVENLATKVWRWRGARE